MIRKYFISYDLISEFDMAKGCETIEGNFILPNDYLQVSEDIRVRANKKLNKEFSVCIINFYDEFKNKDSD